MTDDLLTIAEAAALLHVSRSRVHHLIADGALPGAVRVDVPRRSGPQPWRVPLAAVRAYLAQPPKPTGRRRNSPPSA